MEQPDYKRLYEEALDYQVRYAIAHGIWKEENAEENRGWIEFIADMVIKNKDERDESFSSEFVEEYLNHRRKIWNETEADNH